MNDPRFWLKTALLAFWSVVVGSFVFALTLAAKNASLLDQWLLSIAGVLYGGAGFSYIERIYRLPLDKVGGRLALPAAALAAGTALFIAGVLTAALRHTPIAVLGLLLAIVGVLVAASGVALGED